MNPKLNASYDVVVVGSGHNGLVAAAYLAKAGRSVLVLEKNGSFGGATASQRVFPDYDALLSRYSYLVSLLPDKIVKDLDLDFKTRMRSTASFTPWVDQAGQHRGLVLSNTDPQRSRESMLQLTGKHSTWQRYQQFLSLQNTIARLVWPTMLERLRSRAAFESCLESEEQRRAWRSFVERPLGESIEDYADHDALRGLLLTDGKIGLLTHAHDPSLLQNRCFLYHVIGNETGEWRVPIGGMRSLVESLLHRCRLSGVRLISGATAKRVDVGKAAHEVTFSIDGTDQCVRANDVVINAGPRTFAKLLDEPLQTTPGDEGSVIKINMLLERLPKLKATDTNAAEAFAGSFHIDEGYQQMQTSFEAATRGEIPQPAPGEVYCHTLTDASILSKQLAGRGFHTLTLFGLDMPWRIFESDHDARKAKVAKLYLDGLNNLCDEPFEDCLALDSDGQACIEIKTPQDLQSEVDLDRGNIFHNELSWFYGQNDQVGTWGVETRFARVFKAGASAIRGGAVSGIPGHNAAMCILG